MANSDQNNDEESEIKRTPKGFEYRKGKWVPWWGILFIPILIVFEFLYRYTKEDVNWYAAWGVVICFELMFIPAEHYHLSRGHWVYNEARILGPKFWGMPIEEPCLYMFFSPLVIICTFLTIKRYLINSNRKGAK